MPIFLVIVTIIVNYIQHWSMLMRVCCAGSLMLLYNAVQRGSLMFGYTCEFVMAAFDSDE